MDKFIGILTFILTIWRCCSASSDPAAFEDVLNRLAILEMKAAGTENLQRENINIKKGMEQYKKMSRLMEINYIELKNSLRKEVEIQNNKLKTMETKYLDMVRQLQDRINNQEVTIKYFKMNCGGMSEHRTEVNDNSEKGNDNSYTNKTQPSGTESENIIDRINTYTDKTGPSESLTPEFGNIVQNKIGDRIRKNEYQQIDKRLNFAGDVSTVAFAASLSHSLDHLAASHTIAFDHIYINEGNGYNGSDGIFVCPMSGLYLFSFNLHLDIQNQLVGCEIKVNGVSKVWSFAATTASDVKDNAPGTTVVRLNTGDHVWLSIMYDNSHIFGGSLSNFMGVRIAK